MKKRLKLFDATVTATALYGSEAWTLKDDQQRRLRTTHRKKLRAILGAKRKVINDNGSSDESDPEGGENEDNETSLEPWPDFLRRTTQQAEGFMAAAKLEDWLTTWRRRKWRWAGRLESTQGHKWSHKALGWSPDIHGRHQGHRSQGRPCKRWEDDLSSFCRDQFSGTLTWKELARDRPRWNDYEDKFAKFADRQTRAGP